MRVLSSLIQVCKHNICWIFKDLPINLDEAVLSIRTCSKYVKVGRIVEVTNTKFHIPVLIDRQKVAHCLANSQGSGIYTTKRDGA